MFTLEHDQQQMLQITFLFVIRELAPMNPPNGCVCVCWDSDKPNIKHEWRTIQNE